MPDKYPQEMHPMIHDAFWDPTTAEAFDHDRGPGVRPDTPSM